MQTNLKTLYDKLLDLEHEFGLATADVVRSINSLDQAKIKIFLNKNPKLKISEITQMIARPNGLVVFSNEIPQVIGWTDLGKV